METDKLKWLLIGAISTLLLNLTMFSLKFLFDRNEKIDKLKNDVFGLCDKLIRFSISIETYAIQTERAKRIFELTKIETARNHYFDLMNRTNDLGLEMNFIKSDLIKVVQNLNLYNHKNKLDLNNLIKRFHQMILKRYDGIFEGMNDKDKIDIKSLNLQNELDDKILIDPHGKSLRDIQILISPTFFV